MLAFTTPFTKPSSSAYSSKISGATPPCSKAQRVPGASFDFKYQPTFAEPIKLKNATRESVTNFSEFSRLVSATCIQPLGKPASSANSAKRKQHKGVTAAGLIITGQPVAIAGIAW